MSKRTALADPNGGRELSRLVRAALETPTSADYNSLLKSASDFLDVVSIGYNDVTIAARKLAHAAMDVGVWTNSTYHRTKLHNAWLSFLIIRGIAEEIAVNE